MEERESGGGEGGGEEGGGGGEEGGGGGGSEAARGRDTARLLFLVFFSQTDKLSLFFAHSGFVLTIF